MSHVVLEGMAQAAIAQLAETQYFKTTGQADVCLTVDGHELDVQKFCDHWQGQVDRMIKERARALVEERANDALFALDDAVTALKQRLDVLFPESESLECLKKM